MDGVTIVLSFVALIIVSAPSIKNLVCRCAKRKGGERMSTVFERVRKIVVDKLGVAEGDVKPSSALVDDLHADSLDLVELTMAVEEEFQKDKPGLSVTDEQAEKMITIQDILDYLKSQEIEDK